MSINQVKKTSKGGGFSPCQAPIEINIPNMQIRVCTYLMGYYPLSHKSAPTNEAISHKKRSLYGQITLQGQRHGNKNPTMGQRLQL